MFKFHRHNSDFQIEHFIAGAAHTPDARYFVLRELEEERQRAVRQFELGAKKRAAARLRAQAKAKSIDEADQLDGEAELDLMAAAEPEQAVLYQAAKAELATIQRLLEEVRSARRYADRPDAEAAELTQREEWKLELIFRAQTYLWTQGTIPQDHFAVMRRHPDFEGEIFPAIEIEIRKLSAARRQVALPPSA